ncbi:cohesin domain-containing protein [Clostridium sp. JS66]|uniref:cohesin domain-containing protein n=1 Tax=Clostridium sp. JS66 TaxID=3064705 RepID=UPI00298DC43C|nr:cohesin domain-containing protein [Clostridium sp. JS66]WPC42976.1 cohesin domain-containing protein [Clostridium sp. JS66]
MNKFKSLMSKIVIVFAMALIVGVLGSSNVYAANIGDVLSSPEDGWKRIEDSNVNIQYLGGVWECKESSDSANYFHTAGRNDKNEVKFNFTGDKIRLIMPYHPEVTSSVSVIVDNVTKNFSLQYANKRMVLVYENEDISSQEHSCDIKFGGDGYAVMDAIDIDKNGEIKPYNKDLPIIKTILNVEPEKNKIKLNETVSANLTIDNIKDIAAEDVRIKYDNTKLQFLGATEVDGIKLVKNDAKDGELRLILASKGAANVVEAKKTLLKLNFKGIAAGDALVDVTKGRVSDGITMEKDLTDDQCGQATITIDNEALADVNKDGQFTLLDLGIDGRHYSEDPTTLTQYNTDIVVNKAIDDDDLTKIGEYMLTNPNYKF